MALDHADTVTKLALLDIVPTAFAFANVDKDMATAAFNWFFSIQPDDLPERMIGAQREFYLRYLLDHWAGNKDALSPEAIDEYLRCFDIGSIRATCEEFRAASTIDLEHDERDKNKKVACPTLVLWSSNSMWAGYEILEIWRSRAETVKGRSFNCGHFLPEEDPDGTVDELLKFL
jgi:haloacetate dehalogenase